MTLRVLSLFAGIGGFDLGLERTGGFKTVAFCEIDPFCQRVLAKHWPRVPIHSDVRALKGDDVGPIDVLVGGYPCQPFSVAGERRGTADDRHLWPEMHRLLDELGPAWVIGENVAGHINMGLDDVLSDLGRSGYSARPFVIPAVAIGAPHRRDRVWIVAHRESIGRGEGDKDCGRRRTGIAKGQEPRPRHDCRPLADAHPGQRIESIQEIRARRDAAGGCGEAVAHPNRERGRSRNAERENASYARQPSRREEHWGWHSEPNVGRVVNGLPNRVDRLRCLGNAVVPQSPELIGRAILASIQEIAA